MALARGWARLSQPGAHGLVDIGVTNLVMDFGHPLHHEPAVRFAEQVIAPIRSSRS